MAVDTITPISLIKNSGVSVATRTAITASNTFKIPISSVKDRKLVVHILNTYAGEKIVTFDAGDIGEQAVMGELEIPVAASTGEKAVCLESSRFFQADGFITGKYETGMTGFISCYILP